MRIGIIGGGIMGSTIALRLAEKGHQIILWEKQSYLGGLAAGFKLPSWQWSIEQHYHHIFTNDLAIINLAKQIGASLKIYQPKTSVFYQQQIFRLDNPLSLWLFPHLGIYDKLKTSLSLAYLKFVPFWRQLETLLQAPK